MADIIDKKELFKEVLTDAVNKIKPQMSEIINAAVMNFYASASPGTYERTLSVFNINKPPAEYWGAKSVRLTYTFSSGDISVNSWDSPWGVHYPGNAEIAFDKAYDEGYHGGPKPSKGGWTWSMTQKSDPIGETIWQLIDTIEI